MYACFSSNNVNNIKYIGLGPASMLFLYLHPHTLIFFAFVFPCPLIVAINQLIFPIPLITQRSQKSMGFQLVKKKCEKDLGLNQCPQLKQQQTTNSLTLRSQQSATETAQLLLSNGVGAESISSARKSIFLTPSISRVLLFTLHEFHF